MLHINSIGRLETPFLTLADCPRNGRQPKPPPLCRAHVDPSCVPGLLSLEGFSHLILLSGMHAVSAPKLCFVPPFDASPRGVFATRAPFRPNPIGLSVVKFDGFESPGCLLVRYLDCLNGTALLDIKPYLPTTDSEPNASMGWLGSPQPSADLP